MKCRIFMAAALLLSMPLAAQEMDAGGLLGEEDVQIKDLLPKSRKAADLKWKIPNNCDSFGFTMKLVNPGIVKIFFETKGSKKIPPLTIRPSAQTLKRDKSEAELFGKASVEISQPDDTFQNHVLQFSCPAFRADRFVMPCFSRYKPEDVNKNIARWEETFPNALTCVTHLEFRPGARGIRCYADGLYMGEIPAGGSLQNVRVTGGAGAVITNAKPFADKYSTPDFEAVNIAYAANPGAMKESEPSLGTGFRLVEGVPMFVSGGAGSSDLSLVRGLRGMYFAAEVDFYMSRTSWERHESTQQWSIPNGMYHKVCILFALDPDPGKDRAFSFRLGRFTEGGRGHTSWAYTDVFLPDAGKPMPENIREVGKVRLRDKEIPLYLGIFPIDAGNIVHVVTNDVNAGQRRRDYLDFDIMGRRCRPGAYNDPSHRPDGTKKSAVNVFGITFCKAGAAMHLEQKEPGNIFFNDEKPETAFRLRAERPGHYTFSWRILDTDGTTELRKGSEQFDIEKAGEEKTVSLDLAEKDLGHYRFDVSLARDGEELFTHRGSFALLGPDTRRASCLESPFGSWYTPWHGGVKDPDIYLKIFRKAGIRRPCGLNPFDRNGTLLPGLLEKYKQYNVTLNQFGWATPPDKEKNPAEFDEFMHKTHDPYIQAFPDTKYALVFHESFGDPWVPERFGEKGSPTDNDRKFAKTATDVAEWFRKNHPDIKLVYGNNTSSSALTAALLRCGFKEEYLDFIGIETPGQGCIPERIWQGGTQGCFIARETAKAWGVQAKITGCFEFSARPARLFENTRIQAAYFIRDALIGLAYGFETLGLSGLNQSDNWYNQTIWGGGGALCGISPMLYPNPMLTAYASLTRALDRIEFRPVSRNTDNLSCYALEFTRKEGGFVYALWVPRGTSEVRFDFPQEIQATHIEFLGKTGTLSGKTLNLTASEYPQYLISPVKADAVKHIRTNTPEPPKDWKPEAVFNKLADIRMIPAPCSLEQLDIGLRPGTFEVREVNDPEKGACLEIELIRKGTVPDIVPEYTRIELKKPIVLAGTPDELGLWIKGDASWGKIGFEIQDARGLRFRNEGSWVDFAAKSYINFKGWYFMTYPVAGQGIRPRRSQSLGGEWPGEGPRPMVYPLKLLGLHVTLRRKMLNPAVMTETPCVIRIGGFGGISNPEYQPAK